MKKILSMIILLAMIISMSSCSLLLTETPGATGEKGEKGDDGQDGVGIAKTEINDKGELIITLTDGTVNNLGLVVGKDGADGKDGTNGSDGKDGEQGPEGEAGTNGTNGSDGKDGKSAYELYCEKYGYSGSEEEWLEDLISGTLNDAGNIKNNLTIAVVGDSISTKAGRNAVEITVGEADVGVCPSAYPTYYDIGTVIGGHEIIESDIGSELTFIPSAEDIGKAIGKAKDHNPASTKVWWEHLEDYFNCKINAVTYSSSSYCSHEENVTTLKTAHAWHDSQIRKLGTRIEGSMDRIAPDVVILYRGCNDMTHSPYAKLTEGYFDNCDWQYPTTDKVDGGWGVLEAMSLTIKKIRETYPDAAIVIATQASFKRIDSDNFPTNNILYSLPEFNKALRELADFFGCYTIDFDKCGITYENLYSEGYIPDNTHPSSKGHELMGKQAIKDLVNKLELDLKDYAVIDPETNVLYEKTGLLHPTYNLTDMKDYFSFDCIPVTGGKTYYMPYCRNTAVLDTSGNIIKKVFGPTMEENGYYLTVPKSGAYVRTCARYDAISVSEFSITEVTIEHETNVLYEKTGVYGSTGELMGMEAYFSYDFIPITAGKTYYMPYCRNTAILDKDGKVIKNVGGSTMEENGYYLTIPAGAAYVRTCARYDAISIDEFMIEEVG